MNFYCFKLFYFSPIIALLSKCSSSLSLVIWNWSHLRILMLDCRFILLHKRIQEKLYQNSWNNLVIFSFIILTFIVMINILHCFISNNEIITLCVWKAKFWSHKLRHFLWLWRLSEVPKCQTYLTLVLKSKKWSKKSSYH